MIMKSNTVRTHPNYQMQNEHPPELLHFMVFSKTLPNLFRLLQIYFHF